VVGAVAPRRAAVALTRHRGRLRSRRRPRRPFGTLLAREREPCFEIGLGKAFQGAEVGACQRRRLERAQQRRAFAPRVELGVALLAPGVLGRLALLTFGLEGLALARTLRFAFGGAARFDDGASALELGRRRAAVFFGQLAGGRAVEVEACRARDQRWCGGAGTARATSS